MSARAPFTVLVGIDGSHASEHALRYALRLCEEAGAASVLHVCAVLEPATAIVAGPEDGASADSMHERWLREARGAARIAGREAVTELLQGEPAQALAQRASQLGADLVVLGTRQAHPAVDLLRGSVAFDALQRCPCPVVLVP